MLCDSSTRAAMQHLAARHAAGEALAPPVAALAQEILRTMLAHKLKVVALSLLLLAVVAAGAGWLTHPLAMGNEPRMKSTPPARQPATATTPNHAKPTRLTMINLIPGAPYRFRSRYFTPQPGQTIDLGDVVIAKPPS